MTDFLTLAFPDTNQSSLESTLAFQNIQNILKVCQIMHTSVDQSKLQLIIPFTLLKPCKNLTKFYDYFYMGGISIQNCTLIFTMSVYNQRGLLVKAGSQHQKTLLIKYAMTLNQKNETYQVKVNPLTGEIQLHFGFFISVFTDIESLIYDGINNFKNQSETMIRVLQILQVIPSQCEENSFYNKLLQKIQPLRSIYETKFQAEHNHQKIEQIFKKEPLVAKSNNPLNLSHATNINLIERMRKTYVEGFISMFVHNSTKVKLHNLNYLLLDINPCLENLLKSIDAQIVPPYKVCKQYQFCSQKKRVDVILKSNRKQLINSQYATADKIEKKKNYYTFIKQYVMARNYLQINKFYVMWKKQENNLTNLQQYFMKNFMTISLETKLKIVSQVLCVACICFQRMENFYPSFSQLNILLNSNLQIKLESISRSQINYRPQISQLIYKIIFQRQYLTQKLDKISLNRFASIESDFLKYHGTSGLLKIIIKSVQTFYKCQQNKSSIQNLLLVLARSYDAYQKNLTEHQQANQQL